MSLIIISQLIESGDVEIVCDPFRINFERVLCTCGNDIEKDRINYLSISNRVHNHERY